MCLLTAPCVAHLIWCYVTVQLSNLLAYLCFCLMLFGFKLMGDFCCMRILVSSGAILTLQLRSLYVLYKDSVRTAL
jgi:hypothetical protein